VDKALAIWLEQLNINSTLTDEATRTKVGSTMTLDTTHNKETKLLYAQIYYSDSNSSYIFRPRKIDIKLHISEV
jgi:hypothetical protein